MTLTRSLPSVVLESVRRHSALFARQCSSAADLRRSRLLVCSTSAVAAAPPVCSLLKEWLAEQKRKEGKQQALLVPTALARQPDAKAKAAALRESWEEVLGVAVEPLDLDSYAKTAAVDELGRPRPDEAAAAELEERVSEASMLIVSGGNTFYLQAAVLGSGFSRIAARHAGELGLPYVGQSAGGIVAGRTVHTAFWKGWDDPMAAPGFDFRDHDLARGMDLLDGRAIFPHYNKAMHADLLAKRRRELEWPKRLVALADDEALVWTRDGEVCQSTILCSGAV
eukprot:TRINITY_DN105657_c0_g1_i1.p1 TRINITY_DN105657_c0_g1~~TRINITY_DN105657_c0_g1_i1.p1  ORF type:complete len:282 (-),score=57.44 TRINITY_DN105657_c0_g1_i1:32-877(-)